MKSGILTKYGVDAIQKAVVRACGHDEAIPNVSFGFFGNMECDLVVVSDSSRIHEYEIKRSWSDFLADFKKKRFHDDLRICKLTFVVPEAFACDELKVWCERNYDEWKREFDFMFYADDKDAPYIIRRTERISEDPARPWAYRMDFPERFRTSTYITPEMLEVVRANDRDAPYRRRMFTEELCKLYRLGTIRLWHGWNADGSANSVVPSDEETEVAP